MKVIAKLSEKVDAIVKIPTPRNKMVAMKERKEVNYLVNAENRERQEKSLIVRRTQHQNHKRDYSEDLKTKKDSELFQSFNTRNKMKDSVKPTEKPVEIMT